MSALSESGTVVCFLSVSKRNVRAVSLGDTADLCEKMSSAVKKTVVKKT